MVKNHLSFQDPFTLTTHKFSFETDPDLSQEAFQTQNTVVEIIIGRDVVNTRGDF